MNILAIAAASCVIAFGSWGCRNSPAPSADSSGLPSPAAPAAGTQATIAGFAFVDGSVTSQGSRAKLPPGAKIYPPGSKITGTDGCPTNQYRTDGMIVAVIDYTGRPTSASLQVTEHPVLRGQIDRAPYYLDLNPGRTLQFLGPIFDNGSYDILLTYDYSLGSGEKAAASFVLARNCR
jgi:hypothetical protein